MARARRRATPPQPIPKTSPVAVSTNRALANYTYMAGHAPTEAARAFWAAKATAARSNG